MSKSLAEIQNEVHMWASQFVEPYFEPFSRMAAMTEEVGEVSRIINHMYGKKKKKDDETLSSLEEELGDLIFTFVCMANGEKLTLACEEFEGKKPFPDIYDNSLITNNRIAKIVGDIAEAIYNIYYLELDKTNELIKLRQYLNKAIYLVGYMAYAESIDLDNAWERKMDKVLKRDSSRWERKR